MKSFEKSLGKNDIHYGNLRAKDRKALLNNVSF